MEDSVLTLRTVTLVLAYVHHYTAKYLPGRCLGETHLVRLAAWIGRPAPGLRSARAHRPLAAHLALLHGAGLLDYEAGTWVCRPAAFDWLKADTGAQFEALLAPLRAAASWQATLDRFGFHEVLPIDFSAYLEQSLGRQQRAAPPPPEPATWLDPATADEWRLQLPETLSPWLLFQLLQLGEWAPGEPLRLTAVTLAAAASRGFPFSLVEGVLAAATGAPAATNAPAAAERQRQLAEWATRQGVYTLRPVHLLSTRQPAQLAAIAANRRLRNHFHQQIAPRHAVVSADLIGPLGRWLAQRGYLLETPGLEGNQAGAPDTVYTWLGLRLLAGLGELIEMPFRPPYSSLSAVETQLEPAQLAELEARAQAILEGLRDAIRGRDAFFPAERVTSPSLLEMVRRALADGHDLEITYRSLVDQRPYPRRVQPLRLEQREALYYLHAYCYLAEADRVFRLDRVYDCHLGR